MKNCVKKKGICQIRSDGIDKNKYVAKYTLEILQERHMNKNTKKSIIVSNEGFKYDVSEMRREKQIKVCIYTFFKHYINNN